jgi:hypothetical protein
MDYMINPVNDSIWYFNHVLLSGSLAMSVPVKKKSSKPVTYDCHDTGAAVARIGGLTAAGAAVGGIPGAAAGAMVGGGYELYKYYTNKDESE